MGVLQDNLVLSTELIMPISHRKDIAQALRRSESRNCGLCVVCIQKYGAMLLVGAWQREKQQDKLVEFKAFVDTVRIKSADLKNSIRSDEGLALETSAFESLYGG